MLQKIFNWIGVGLFAGLAMMAKYYAVMLLVSLFLFLFCDSTSRQSFKKPGLYIAAFIFILVMLPHSLWLFQHDFSTFEYSVNRIQGHSDLLWHLLNPMHFAIAHLLAFLGAVVLFGVLLLGKSGPVISPPQTTLTRFDKKFLMILGLGPFILTMALSLIRGNELHALWSMPVVSLWGLILVALIQPVITAARFYRFASVMASVMIIIAVGYMVSLSRAANTSSANYPSREVALFATQLWHHHFHTPLKYVAGSRWAAGVVSYYSKDHPTAYIEWNPKISPWIDEQQLKHEGGIFVWDINDGQQQLTPAIKKRFPKLKVLSIQEFNWERSVDSSPLRLGMAILPKG